MLAITRAGKGQTYIEPVIDMWTREENPNNAVINDPKGELLVKFYVKGTVRGFQIIQFNLINPMKTDIYNPLGLAADAAREGNAKDCAAYVGNIADVFFPVDGGDDPVWPNAANNAFKRAAFGLMCYYLEEEKDMRRRADKANKAAMEKGNPPVIDEKVLDTKIDTMWGKMTLYNCYQMFVRLTSKKLKNPNSELDALLKECSAAFQKAQQEAQAAGLPPEEVKPHSDNPKIQEILNRSSDNPKVQEILNLLPDEYQQMVADTKAKAVLWQDKPETDLLSLYFTAMDMLPRNSMRTLVSNANNALQAMAGAEKMLASVYGIAITAMSFFTDPTISSLTSGTPSQNVDLAGMSFPRRFGVRFHSDFLKRYDLKGLQACWSAYPNSRFNEDERLGLKLEQKKDKKGNVTEEYFKDTKDFYHEDVITPEGWAKCYFKGIFPEKKAYLKLQLKNDKTGQLVRELFFEFEKDYQMTLDGRFYVKDPVLGTMIIKNGVLREMRPFTNEETGETEYRYGKMTFKKETVDFSSGSSNIEMKDTNVIISTQARYSEKTKLVFLVTPPHLLGYAKLILILIKQLVDLNFSQSYMTKDNQKPLYKTRYMLDELGNLQSEGHGIQGFETMLSIGLGQEQQFTLILQTLQQLKDVYGDSVDKIVQGNTSNIVFLKSTDDAMIDTLQKMSGVTHKSYRDSKSVTKDVEKIMMKNEGKVGYTISTKEMPVISYNDMAFIMPRNSIVFRAGDPPVWNRNETILPMSWRMFDNTIIKPGKKYSLQTIPTLSSVLDFDVAANLPDFDEILNKLMLQAIHVEEAKAMFQKAYNYSDLDIAKLEADDSYADEIMAIVSDIIDGTVGKKADAEVTEDTDADEILDNSVGDSFGVSSADDNEEVAGELAQRQAAYEQMHQKIYAGGYLSKSDLIQNDGHARRNQSCDDYFIRAYVDIRNRFEDDTHNFSVRPDGLYNATGSVAYITVSSSESLNELRQLNDAARDEDTKVYSEEDVSPEELNQFGTYRVSARFYEFLASLPSWDGLCDGEFERVMTAMLKEDNT